jgi:hypothetical protein
VHWPINLEEEGVLVEVVDAEVVNEDAEAEVVLTEVDEVEIEDVVDEEDHVQDVKRRKRNGFQLPSWDAW